MHVGDPRSADVDDVISHHGALRAGGRDVGRPVLSSRHRDGTERDGAREDFGKRGREGTHVLPVQTGGMNLSEMCVTRDRVFPHPSQTKSVAPGEIVCGGVGWGVGRGVRDNRSPLSL